MTEIGKKHNNKNTFSSTSISSFCWAPQPEPGHLRQPLENWMPPEKVKLSLKKGQMLEWFSEKFRAMVKDCESSCDFKMIYKLSLRTITVGHLDDDHWDWKFRLPYWDSQFESLNFWLPHGLIRHVCKSKLSIRNFRRKLKCKFHRVKVEDRHGRSNEKPFFRNGQSFN